MRADIKPVIARAQEFVGVYELNNDPADLTVEIDGRPAVIENGLIKIDAGQRRLVATAKGFEPMERYLNAKSGDNGVLGIKLEAAQPAPAGSEALVSETEPADNNEEPLVTDTSNTKVVPWILVGTGAAMAVVGGVFIGLFVKDVNTVKNAVGLWPELKAAQERVPIYSGLGFALLGVGAATATVGAFMRLTNDKKGNESAARGVLELRAGLRGLSVAGQF
jgi:hypothetical protein